MRRGNYKLLFYAGLVTTLLSFTFFAFTLAETEGVSGKVKFQQGDFRVEAGQIILTHEWKDVNFDFTFEYPVVVAKPLSYNGTDPATVAIKDVTPNGFKVRIQEGKTRDGA